MFIEEVLNGKLHFLRSVTFQEDTKKISKFALLILNIRFYLFFNIQQVEKPFFTKNSKKPKIDYFK